MSLLCIQKLILCKKDHSISLVINVVQILFNPINLSGNYFELQKFYQNMIQQTQFNSSDGCFNQSSQIRPFDSGVLHPRWEHRSPLTSSNYTTSPNSSIHAGDTSHFASLQQQQQQQQQISSNTIQYPSSLTKNFCDEIDDIMKHDDVLLISPSPSSLTNVMSPTSTDQDFDLDTFNDYFEPQLQFNKQHIPSYIEGCSQHRSVTDAETNSPSQSLHLFSICPPILSPPSSTSSSFLQLSNTQPVDVIHPTVNSNCIITLNNLSNSNSTPSHPSSSLGISPKFIDLSLNCTFPDKSSQQQQQQRILRKTAKSFYKPSQYQYSSLTKSQTQQLLGTSYPFEVQQEFMPEDNQSHRFRSANQCGLFDTIQCTDLKIENQSALDEQHQQQQIKSPTSYISVSPLSYLSRTSTTNGSSSSISNESNVTNNNNNSNNNNNNNNNNHWSFPLRAVSNSFSGVQPQQQQQNTNLSSSYGGFSSTQSFMKNFSPHATTLKSPIRRHSRSSISKTNNLPEIINFHQTNCTLYSLNNNLTTNTTNSTIIPTLNNIERKERPSLSFSTFTSKGQDEIKDDSSSPPCINDLQSESDLWSDMENDYLRDEDGEDNDPEHIDNSNNFCMTETNKVEATSPVAMNTSSSTTGLETSNGNQSSSFWQYNVQAKGPKTKRVLYLKERDPHLYREFSDPVYQIKLAQTKGNTLNKLRKGDGNDVTPNPVKLYQLGKQIQDLSGGGVTTSSCLNGLYLLDNSMIDTSAITAQPNDSLEVKKEKNKIASRACRLRKKAQHEANKLKLHGLNEEH
ncbi:unnamed protein product, partial [Didymodactylos carnosus]